MLSVSVPNGIALVVRRTLSVLSVSLSPEPLSSVARSISPVASGDCTCAHVEITLAARPSSHLGGKALIDSSSEVM